MDDGYCRLIRMLIMEGMSLVLNLRVDAAESSLKIDFPIETPNLCLMG